MLKPQFDLWDFAPFMQLTATLYLGCIALSKYDKFTNFLLRITSNNYSEENDENSKNHAKLGAEADKNKDNINLSLCNENIKLCSKYLNTVDLYNKKIKKKKKKAETETDQFKYFRHHSLYLFLFCFGFLVVFPTLSFISDVSIYRMTIVFSFLTTFYLICLYWFFRNIKQVNSYLLILLSFLLLMLLSYFICFITFENHFSVIWGYFLKNHHIIVIFTMVFTVMLGFAFHIINITYSAYDKKKIDKLYDYINNNKVKIQNILKQYSIMDPNFINME